MSSVLGSDGTTVKFSIARDKLQIEYSCPGGVDWERTVFFALQTKTEAGSAVVPFSETFEGSTVFSALPGEPDLPPVDGSKFVFGLRTDLGKLEMERPAARPGRNSISKSAPTTAGFVCRFRPWTRS